MAGLKQLNWASEGVGATAAALVDLSTVAGNKISNPPWVKFQSAGWVNFPSAPTSEEELLLRLVALNSQRAAEEAKGQIRWLRPEYQNPSATKAPEQSEAELDAGDEVVLEPAAKVKKITWPKGMREQIAAVRNTLGNQAMTLESLVAHFAAPKTTTPLIVEALAALEELGMLYQEEGHYRIAS